MRLHNLHIHTPEEQLPQPERAIHLKFENGSSQPGVWDGKMFRNQHGAVFPTELGKVVEWFYTSEAYPFSGS